MSDDLRRKLRLKVKRRLMAEGTTPEPPAARRRVRKKVFKSGAKHRSYDDDEPRMALEGDDGEDDPGEDLPTDTRPVARPRQSGRQSDKTRAQIARGFYVCTKCAVISYVGLGWRRNPPCIDCSGRTVTTTLGHIEDNQDKCTM